MIVWKDYHHTLQFISLLVAAGCLCHAWDRWKHDAHFRECRRKVDQLHHHLTRHDSDDPMCPYCVDFVKGTKSSGKVVFLCGHCFHLKCANSHFRNHQERAGLCPICCKGMAKAYEDDPPEPEGTSLFSTGLEEGRRSFLLASLRRMYPEVISEACMLRWACCSVETWHQELEKPKYKSILWGEK